MTYGELPRLEGITTFFQPLFCQLSRKYGELPRLEGITTQ